MKAAVIVDNRPSPELDAIIEEHKKYLSDDWEVIHIKDKPISSHQDYNNLLVSIEFWEQLPEHILIFQHDSGLLRQGIEDFLQYDMIGAPIRGTEYFNGGLSLRNRDMMLRVIKEVPYDGMNEDMYFSKGIIQLGGKLPDYHTASSFSVETMFALGSLGFHAIDKHLTALECYVIRTQYNEKN